jgi:hypothetical protein
VTTQYIRVSAVLNAIRQAEISAIEQVADVIASDAQHRAPVRRVFKEKPGFRRKFRPLTPIEQSLAIKRANAYYGPSVFKARWQAMSDKQQAKARFNYSHAQIPRRGSANSLSASGNLRVLGHIAAGQFSSTTGASKHGKTGYNPGAITPLLTSRGAYEVRSGRAIHLAATKTGQSVQVGGALKASIGNEGAVETDSGVTAKVSAKIRYAKFVEFPTVHNAAQPFLRPALMANRRRLVTTVAGEIRKVLGG